MAIVAVRIEYVGRRNSHKKAQKFTKSFEYFVPFCGYSLFLIPEFLEVVVIHSKKVCDFVDERSFQLFFELIRRVAFVFECFLKNQNSVWVERLVKVTTLGEGDAFIQAEQSVILGYVHLLLQFFRWVILYDDRDVLKFGSKFLGKFVDCLADQVFKRFSIHGTRC